ncbi:MAG: tRNA epoxyqueuosine(34) reductase QueG, partial [Rhizobiales bacterium]|nr:tRNA epoxyqueuosine(34) reductase QueG [Hyphomicrobiales bacterium]
LISPDLAHLAGLDNAAFRVLFQASPVKRAGRDRFIRNVLIAIGNSGEIELAAQAENLLCDPSPLVRAMAVWALLQLLDAPAFRELREKHRSTENDPAVLAEWGSD